MRQLVIRSGAVPLQVIDHGGRGAEVVLLHGGGRTSRDWDQVAQLLVMLGCRSVAVDLRGHGGTPVAPWTWELVLEDVTAVVEGLGLDRPAVVGHSLGGMVAALWSHKTVRGRTRCCRRPWRRWGRRSATTCARSCAMWTAWTCSGSTGRHAAAWSW